MEETEGHICSLCGVSFIGYGHNPEPLAEYEERCCGDCNNLHVIPSRLLFSGANSPEQIAKAEELVAVRRENLRNLRNQRPAG